MSASDILRNLLRQKYRGLRHLLSSNTEALEMMADIEADLLHLTPAECQFRDGIITLVERTLLLVQDLNLLSDGRYKELFEIHARIEAEIRRYLRAGAEQESPRIAFQLREVDAQMASEVGGKAANLGEVSKLLNSAVPPGFVITAAAYRLFVQHNNLYGRIRTLLKNLSVINDQHLFQRRTEEIRGLIQDSSVPGRIIEAIEEGVQSSLSSASLWAVRSSALGEDGRWSYAGQYDTVLNVPPAKLPEAYRDVPGEPLLRSCDAIPYGGGFSRGRHSYGSAVHADDQPPRGRRHLYTRPGE